MPGGLLGTALRYGASAAGPVAVSGAHFLASLIFLRNLPAREFGLFSFVMVVVSFGMSLNASLITVPLTRHIVTGADDTRPVCFQMNWLVCIGFAALMFAALLAGQAPAQGCGAAGPVRRRASASAGSRAASPISTGAWRPRSSPTSPIACFWSAGWASWR